MTAKDTSTDNSNIEPNNLEIDIKNASIDNVKIDTAALDALNDNIGGQKKPNIKNKSKENNISGIDDISSYIEKKKEKEKQLSTNPEIITANDGTDLKSIPGAYAIVPHKKGDHKIVYLRKNAPKELLADEKKRKKGGKYIKKGHKVYDVHADFMQHPNLRGRGGERIGVWVIDEPKDLQSQIEAIQSGVGGGTNFQSPVVVKNKPKIEEPKAETPKTEEPKVETPKAEEPKAETPKVEEPKVETPKTETPKTETPKTEEPAPFTLNLDDILPKNPVEETKEEVKTENKKKERKGMFSAKTEEKKDPIPKEEITTKKPHGGMFRKPGEEAPKKEIIKEVKTIEDNKEKVPTKDAETKNTEDQKILDLDNISFENKTTVKEQSEKENNTVVKNAAQDIVKTTTSEVNKEEKNEKTTKTRHHKKPKGMSPVGLIIRIVGVIFLFLLLGLILKIAFSSSDETPVEQEIIPYEQVEENVIDPIEKESKEEVKEEVEEIKEEVNTGSSYTMDELKAKLESQQLESRRILNKAKLLGNKEAIKFGTAALLKATKSIEKIKKDSSVTADEIQKDAERTDLYIQQADSLIQ